jgi:hypothetical protein
MHWSVATKWGQAIFDLRNYLRHQELSSMSLQPIIGFRRDTRGFLDDNGLQKSKAEYQKAKDAIDDFIAKLSTRAQKSDADILKVHLLNALAVQMTLAEFSLNDFVSAHRGRFFGPISDAGLEKLAETALWKDEWDILDQKNLAAKAAAWEVRHGTVGMSICRPCRIPTAKRTSTPLEPEPMPSSKPNLDIEVRARELIETGKRARSKGDMLK